jgi:LCP family protein required for cell wall assembly
MNEKEIRNSARELRKEDLRFTNEDREKVFQKIEREESTSKPSFFHTINQRVAPLAAMAVLLTLSIVLVYSFIDSGSQSADHSEKLAAEGNQYSSLLFILENENQRTDLQLLLTYNKVKGTAKLLSLPGDMYVQLMNAGSDKGKLMEVNAFGNGAESVKDSVSNTLNIPIDDYISIGTDDFEYILNTIGETEIELYEEKVLFSYQESEINLDKGEIKLSGSKAVTLLTSPELAGQEENSWSEEDRLQLAQAVIKNMLKHLPPAALASLMVEAESNSDIEKILEEVATIKLNTMETISISEGLDPVTIEDIFYLKQDKDFFKEVQREMTTFE